MPLPVKRAADLSLQLSTSAFSRDILAVGNDKSWRKTSRRVFLTLLSKFLFRSLKTADPIWKKESRCSPPYSTTSTFSSCSSMLSSNRRISLLETGMSFRTKDLAAGGE